MHGWAGSGAYFDSTLEHLDPSLVYCVTLDFAGHGLLAEPPAPCSLDQLADTVTAVADAAGADTFIILGFSMSGKFAQYVTSRHPNRVGQVLVAGCPAGPLALPPELVDDWCSRAGNDDRLLDIVRDCSTRPIPPHVMQAAGRDAARVSETVLRENDRPRCYRLVHPPSRRLADPHARRRRPPGLAPPDVMRDGVAGPLARARLELLDCGHEIPIELPHELAEIVTRFVPECTHSPTMTEVPPSRRR